MRTRQPLFCLQLNARLSAVWSEFIEFLWRFWNKFTISQWADLGSGVGRELLCTETKPETAHWGGRRSQTENERPDPCCRIFMDDKLLECAPVGSFNWPDALPGFVIRGTPEAEKTPFVHCCTHTVHNSLHVRGLLIRISYTTIHFVTQVCFVLSRSHALGLIKF